MPFLNLLWASRIPRDARRHELLRSQYPNATPESVNQWVYPSN
jgi:hypothetical protein